MTKNEIMNDIDFRLKCSDYGLNWDDFEVYGDVIIINTPQKNALYVLFDENYNIIGIHEKEFANMHLTMEELAKGYMELYNIVDEEIGCSFLYPFQNLSLKQIVDLSKRVVIHETNHGHSSKLFVNEELIEENNNEEYIGLLSFIHFLGEQIKQYFFNAYQMKTMGFQYPNVYQYVRNIMNIINKCIDEKIENNTRPFPADIINYLGQGREKREQYSSELYKIISLLLKDKGIEIKGGFNQYKEINPTEKNTEDLSTLSINLLKLLEVPKEELTRRKKERQTTFKVNEIDLKSWLEEPKVDRQVLKKTPNPQNK